MIVGGGKNGTVSAGDSKYAVNMDIGGGKHRYVYGGCQNGTVNGNIAVWAYDCLINNLYSGAGNSNVNGNVYTNINMPEYQGTKATGNFYGGAVATVDLTETTGRDTTITGDVTMEVETGDFQGIIFGGSRAWGTVATIEGTVTVTADTISSTNNLKLIKTGSTAWVIGGSQIMTNSGAAATGNIVGGVVMNLGASNLVNVVGAGQADGTGATLNVSAVEINIINTTITDSVFGAGYAANGSVINVGDVTVNITGNAGSSTTIGGILFAAGKTVGTGGTINVTGDVTVNFSGTAENISVGNVNALGKGSCTVDGAKILSFSSISGTLGGSFLNFDTVKFSGETQLSAVGNPVDTSEWYFDAWNRTQAMPFVTSADSFNLQGDDRVIGLSFATTANVSFDLMDVSDEDLAGVTVKFFGQDGTEIGSCEFGETIAIGTKGYVSLDIDQDGILVASYTKGQLA
jgi:hypothetical protein